MAQRGVRARLTDAVDARSVGVVTFGVGVVAYWSLRDSGQYFGALVPLFLFGIAGLLLGYSTGYDRGRADADRTDAAADADPSASGDGAVEAPEESD